MQVREFMLESGVFPNILGFNYLIRAVEIVKKDGGVSTINKVYPQIAEEFKTTAIRVERGIRYVRDMIPYKQFKKHGFAKVPTSKQLIYAFAFRRSGGKHE